MHDTAFEIAKSFFSVYVPNHARVIELGAADFNGCIRDGLIDRQLDYVACDLCAGPKIDVVIDLSEEWLPFPIESFDVAVASSVFEHDDFFWDTFLKICHVIKPGGLIYINVPSNGWVHRYPVDNWRFYPDAGHALAKWARHNKQPIILLESFIARRRSDVWNDFCAIFFKGSHPPAVNGKVYRRHETENIFDVNIPDSRLNEVPETEDQRIINRCKQLLQSYQVD